MMRPRTFEGCKDCSQAQSGPRFHRRATVKVAKGRATRHKAMRPTAFRPFRAALRSGVRLGQSSAAHAVGRPSGSTRWSGCVEL